MTGSATSTELARPLLQVWTLGVIGVAGLLLAAVLATISTEITTRTWDEPGDDATVAALAWWGDVSVTVGIVALVGAVVLTGVVEIARRTVRELSRDCVARTR